MRAARVVASFTGLLLLALAVGSLLVALTPGDGTRLDLAVLDAFHRGRTPLRSALWSVVTDAGDAVFLVPAAAAVGLAWRWRRDDWLGLQLLGGAYLGAALLHGIAKPLVGRERPGADVAFTPETGLAFPSGHAAQASAFWVALALLALTVVVGRAARVLVVVLTAAVVVLVAVSRLYLGAHWLTDVVAGTVLGAAWAGALWWSLTLTEREVVSDAARPADPDGSVRGTRS
ncbi:MAG: phosphatase PAP2 family protein [Actinobacteria bacterium]|nr:phosphatase PAP2 family protein [Actinomycetota bacterium]